MNLSMENREKSLRSRQKHTLKEVPFEHRLRLNALALFVPSHDVPADSKLVCKMAGIEEEAVLP